MEQKKKTSFIKAVGIGFKKVVKDIGEYNQANEARQIDFLKKKKKSLKAQIELRRLQNQLDKLGGERKPYNPFGDLKI